MQLILKAVFYTRKGIDFRVWHSWIQIIILLLTSFSVTLVKILEKAMAPHSRTLAWKIPCTEEPGRLQSMGSWRVGHDWATSHSLFTFMHWRRKWQSTPVLENPRDGGAWWAAVYGVALSQTQLTWLSSSNSSSVLIKSRNVETYTHTHTQTHRRCYLILKAEMGVMHL